MKNRTKKSGYSLVEVMVASGVSATVLGFSVGLLVTCASNWGRGEKWLENQDDVRSTVRRVQAELREAVNVTIDANGEGITYQLPTKDANGNYVIPLAANGVNRRIYLNGTQLMLNDGNGNPYPLCNNIITTDPMATTSGYADGVRGAMSGTSATSAPAYKIFTPGPGVNLRIVYVQLVTNTRGAQQDQAYGRRREAVYLRNIPTTVN